MDARVKQDSRYGSIMAFSGLEYVKHEWRPVPAGQEAAARENQYLEVRGTPKSEKVQAVVEEPASATDTESEA